MTEFEAIEKMLSVAAAEVGYHEQGENITKYATDYDFDTRLYGFDMSGLPWCSYFVSWVFCKAFGYEYGSAMIYQYSGCSGAACAAAAEYYQMHNAWSTTPHVGDQIFFYVSGGINHTGVIEEVSDSYIRTIEGNSSDSVKRNTYRINDQSIAGYGTPAWRYVSLMENSAETAENEDFCESCQITFTRPKISENTLMRGKYGEPVAVLQACLNYYGADLKIDRDFGVLTEAAVKEYQREHTDINGSPLEVDGIVGSLTWGSF